MISDATRALQRRRYRELTPARHEEIRQYQLKRKARVRKERKAADYDKIMRKIASTS